MSSWSFCTTSSGNSVKLTTCSTVIWFRWHEGTYQPLAADDRGILRSEVFPGLWLAVDALLEGDLRTVKEVLELGLAQESA
ncbi:MAG: hypothetical protein EA395_10570 [Phormidium sp. GEM2.Bin31]|nr:hypothetical protein [Phormidium sp. BM_Day4_Bin.17]TVR09055.1 MAG: hypothetical protein EA395_10570 [Phormidium sp. GEM2.Bin31]UCJ14573.1 MAG: hypothetical protein JWS08_10320 [Phormidium sp. PBR-2020]